MKMTVFSLNIYEIFVKKRIFCRGLIILSSSVASYQCTCHEYISEQPYINAYLQIDGLHLTSWWPCWRYNTKEYLISSIVGSSRRGWLVLCATSREIDCKPRISLIMYVLVECSILCSFKILIIIIKLIND